MNEMIFHGWIVRYEMTTQIPLAFLSHLFRCCYPVAGHQRSLKMTCAQYTLSALVSISVARVCMPLASAQNVIRNKRCIFDVGTLLKIHRSEITGMSWRKVTIPAMGGQRMGDDEASASNKIWNYKRLHLSHVFAKSPVPLQIVISSRNWFDAFRNLGEMWNKRKTLTMEREKKKQEHASRTGCERWRAFIQKLKTSRKKKRSENRGNGKIEIQKQIASSFLFFFFNLLRLSLVTLCRLSTPANHVRARVRVILSLYSLFNHQHPVTRTAHMEIIEEKKQKKRILLTESKATTSSEHHTPNVWFHFFFFPLSANFSSHFFVAIKTNSWHAEERIAAGNQIYGVAFV